jgi:hypothetical protein
MRSRAGAGLARSRAGAGLARSKARAGQLAKNRIRIS